MINDYKKILEQQSWNRQAILSRNRKPTAVQVAKRLKGISLLEKNIANYNLKGETVINATGGNGQEANLLLDHGVEKVILLDFI